MKPPRAPFGRGRTLAAAAVVCSAVALPVLVAGSGIDQPAAAGEWEQIAGAAGLPGPFGPWFEFLAAAEGPTELARLTAARLRNLLAVFALSGLLYVLLATSGSRSRALFATLTLAASPALVQEGSVIRPELPLTVTLLLGVTLLVMMAEWILRRQDRTVTALSHALLGGALVALGPLGMPSYGLLHLVPGGALALVLFWTGRRALRVVLRRGIDRYPAGQVTRRMLPWVLASLASLASGAFLPGNLGAEASAGSASLLWDHRLLQVAFAVPAAVGVLSLVLRTGIGLSRQRRLGGEVLVVVLALVLLLQPRVQAPGSSVLPAAVGLSIFAGEGLRVLSHLLFAGLRRRSRPG